MLHAEGLIDGDAEPRRDGARATTSRISTISTSCARVLEGYAARRAATRVSDEHVDALRESCERFVGLLGRTTT